MCPLWLQGGAIPPLAPERLFQRIVHGHLLTDNWAWLADRDDPDLPRVLEQEERYAARNLKRSSGLARKLYQEFTRSLARDEASHPYLLDGYYYWVRSPRSGSHQVHYRLKDTPGAEEEVLLDENKLARGSKYFSLGLFQGSRDGAKLAYSVDLSGDEDYTLYVKDLKTGKTTETGIRNAGQALWLIDGSRMVVTTYNDRLQCDQALLYDTVSGALSPIYREEDPVFDLDVYFSAGRDLIFLDSSAADINRVWFLDASSTDPELVSLTASNPGCRAYPEYLNGEFYVMIDRFHMDSGIYQYDPSDTTGRAWKEIVPPISGAPLQSFILMEDTVAVIRRQQGFKRLELYSVSGGMIRTITPEVPSDLDFWFNADPTSPLLMYSLESELQPFSIVSHNLATGTEKTVYQTPAGRIADTSDYCCELIWVPAQDSILIPLRLIRRKDLDPGVTHPLWLYGYGAYGDCEDPYHSDTLFSLLDRGFIYAVAHVRGGGEFGRSWYDDGRIGNKKNTFADFAACIDHLIAGGYTEADKLVIEGGSAGGLLVGSVLNLVPQKIRLAIADVPFVDLANTMLDPELPLTLQEYDEWGDPSSAEDFAYMLSYSPYDNVSPRVYPTVLAITAWNDIRVGYWEALKWVQKLRVNNLGTAPALYLMRREGGHTGSNDIRRDLRNYAQIMAFAIDLITSPR